MTIPSIEQLQRMRNRFAPTRLEVELSHFSSRERKALRHCVQAAEVLNEIYFLQVYHGNPKIRERISEPRSAMLRLQLEYFSFR